MSMQFNSFAFALSLTSGISLLLAGLTARRRNTLGRSYFVLAMLAVSCWSLAYALELTATHVPIKFFWHKVSYAGALSLPPLWFLFALYNSYRPKKIASRWYAGLFALPVACAVLTFSNRFYTWFWSEVHVVISGFGNLLVFTYGPVFWINAAYAYGLMLAGSLILAREALHSSSMFRKQTFTLIGAVLLPWIANILFITGATPLSGLDFTPLCFAVSGILITKSIFRYHLLELKPVAYDLLFASMENEVLVLDKDNRLLEANPAARRLFDIRETNLGQPFDRWLDRIPELACLFQEKQAEQCEISFEVDGCQVWRGIQMAPLFHDGQQLCGKLIVLTDITQRKLAEEQLDLAHKKALEASRMKTRLLASISHDLRSPITAILGFSELLYNEVLGQINEQQRIALENIQESANQQLNFLNNLIGQAQLETGQVILNIQHFPVRELIEPVRNSFEFLAARKGIEFKLISAPNLPELLYGDPYWIRQIMLNLVHNAIKFTQQGSITVYLYQNAEHLWSFQVSDTGAGIPEDKLELIFEPFRQLNEGRASQSGSGLGLSIVKQLVELMKGEIKVESAPGKGSTFTVSLPYKQPVALEAINLLSRVSA